MVPLQGAAGTAPSEGAVRTKDSCPRTGVCAGDGLSDRHEASLGEGLGDREGLPGRVKLLLQASAESRKDNRNKNEVSVWDSHWV